MIVSSTNAGIKVLCKEDFDYLRKELPLEIDFYLKSRHPMSKLTITMRANGNNHQIREEVLSFTLGSDLEQIVAGINGAERLLSPKWVQPRTQDASSTSHAG